MPVKLVMIKITGILTRYNCMTTLLVQMQSLTS